MPELQTARIHFAIAMLLFATVSACRAESDTIASHRIPFDSMTASNQVLVRGVTDHYTLRREYSAREFKAQVATFEYLLDHMDACSALAQRLGLITYRATRDADGRFQANDREGAAGYLVSIYVDAGNHREPLPGMRVFYVEGAQHGLFDVRGRGVAVVDYHRKSPDTIEYTRVAFVKVDNVVLAALAQLFSVFLQGTVDRHFEHVIRHPIMLSKKAQLEPQKLLDEIARMPAADQELLAPFSALVQSNADSRLSP